MRTVLMSFGRALDHKPANPERTAFRSGNGFASPMTFREWTSRGAMATTIRMQQARESRLDDWKPCIPLMDVEGHRGYQAKTLEQLREVFEPSRAYVWKRKEVAA